jgi:catalase
VRYSNGVGWRQSDDTLDARGMAVKVMQVEGKKYLDDEKLTQDFLMTNSPTPVGENAEEFMKFAHANVNGRIAGIFFLLGHPVTAGPALTSTNPIDSSVTAEYWSGGAYHLGANQAIKYMTKPCAGTPPRHPSRKDPDYLKADLADAARGGICFTMYVQFQVDPEETPIENASKRWDEELSVPVAVGDIVMPPQAVTTGDFCDGLAFNPWHAIPAHAPMGHINRARRLVYSWSQDLRKRSTEPLPWTDPAAPTTAAQAAPAAPAPSAPAP